MNTFLLLRPRIWNFLDDFWYVEDISGIRVVERKALELKNVLNQMEEIFATSHVSTRMH